MAGRRAVGRRVRAGMMCCCPPSAWLAGGAAGCAGRGAGSERSVGSLGVGLSADLILLAVDVAGWRGCGRHFLGSGQARMSMTATFSVAMCGARTAPPGGGRAGLVVDGVAWWWVSCRGGGLPRRRRRGRTIVDHGRPVAHAARSAVTASPSTARGRPERAWMARTASSENRVSDRPARPGGGGCTRWLRPW